MYENTVCLLLKNHQDAMEKMAQQQVAAFQALFDTLRAELQATRGLLQNRQGAGVIKRLRIIGFNLVGVAAEWFQWMSQNGLITTWDRFVESVKIRFGPSKYEDQQGALSKLLQLGTMEDYQREFEKLMNRVTDIPNSLLIYFYILGPKLNLQHELLVSRPTMSGDAFSLARIIESSFEAVAEKEQNIKEKANTTLSLPIKEVSHVVKGRLDASEDTLLSLRSEDPNFKIQEKAVEYVRALNDAPLKVVFAGPVDEVSSVIEDVFDIDESNVECMQVRDTFAKFFEDKGSVEKVLSATKLPKGENSHSIYSPYHLKDKVNFEGVGNVTPWAAEECLHVYLGKSIKSAFQDNTLRARYHALQNRTFSVAEVRKNMCMYLKNQGGYKMSHLKGMSYEEIRPIFERVWDQIQSFVPMDSEKEKGSEKKTEGRLKRAGQDVVEEPAKRQKTTEASESVQEQLSKEPKADELSQEQLQQMMLIVPEEGMHIEALQIKVGNHTELYQVFDDMLKNFEREDLDKLWSLVKERFNSPGLTDDKEKELRIELKRLFEPDDTNTLWKLQRYMHDPLIWWLYDTCGVHHVSTKRGHDIFMLVEKDYPLTTTLCF
ncbi:class II heat shock protein [Tanacetum coccineum]